MVTVYVKLQASFSGGPADKYYRCEVSQRWLAKHDNGAVFSCGLTVGQDGLTMASFQRLNRTEVTREQWNHSGCQSSCVLRGGKECRW